MSFDLPFYTSSVTRRHGHEKPRSITGEFGRKLKRKRLLQCFEGIDKATAFYENHRHHPYLNLEFLNPHDVVLAMNAEGEIDFLGIDRYGESAPTQEISTSRYIGRSDDGGRTLRHACKPLALNVKHKHTESLNDSQFCAMRSIRQGDAVAVGTVHGDLVVIATERGDANSWCQKQSRMQRTSLCQKPVNPINSDQSFVVGSWEQRGARRRFYRDDSICSIVDQFLRRRSGCNDLYEIDDWMFRPFDYSSENKQRRQLWDFREASSNVMAVHVGLCRDHLGIHILDGRQKCNSGKGFQVAIDVELPKDGNFTNCRFVNDWGVATISQSRGQEIDKESGTKILKLFDIRKMNSEAITEHTVSSFPRDKVSATQAFNQVELLDCRQESLLFTLENQSKLAFVNGSGDARTVDIVDLGNPKSCVRYYLDPFYVSYNEIMVQSTSDSIIMSAGSKGIKLWGMDQESLTGDRKRKRDDGEEVKVRPSFFIQLESGSISNGFSDVTDMTINDSGTMLARSHRCGSVFLDRS